MGSKVLFSVFLSGLDVVTFWYKFLVSLVSEQGLAEGYNFVLTEHKFMVISTVYIIIILLYAYIMVYRY